MKFCGGEYMVELSFSKNKKMRLKNPLKLT